MSSDHSRTPTELIHLYWEEVWNKGRVELIREICADPIVRYDVDGCTTRLSHDEQIARVTTQVAALKPRFTHEVLVGDDRHVVSVWNMTSETDANFAGCGIEAFRAENGRFVGCWNAPYAKGRWGVEGDPPVPSHLGPPEIVHAADAITHEWVQKVFKAAQVEVPRIAGLLDVTPVGHGTTSCSVRVRFSYNADAAGAPQSLVVKMAPVDKSFLDQANAFGVYRREVMAYSFFPPEPPFRIPRCYLAAGEGSDFNIVLEDLTGLGDPGDQIAGCSVAEAEAVMRECTALHVRYWNDEAAAALDWPVNMRAFGPTYAAVFATGAAAMRRQFADRLGDDLDIVDMVAELIEPWSQRRIPYATIIHGDPRVDNIFFERTADGVRACLLDLQQVGHGDPAWDIAYFLSGSLDPADRRSCERRLVDAHSAAIAAIDPDYDPAAAWERYRAHSFAGLMATVAAAGSITRNARNDELLVTLARRNCAAIRELDGIEAARQAISGALLPA